MSSSIESNSAAININENESPGNEKISRYHRKRLRRGGQHIAALLRQGYEELGCRDNSEVLIKGGSQAVCYYLDKLKEGIEDGHLYLVLEYLRWLRIGYVPDQDGNIHFLLSKELSIFANYAYDNLRAAESSLGAEQAYSILREQVFDDKADEHNHLIQYVEKRVEDRLKRERGKPVMDLITEKVNQILESFEKVVKKSLTNPQERAIN